MTSPFIRRVCAAFIVMAAAFSPAQAQKPDQLYVELNRLKPVNDACRIGFVLRNDIGVAISQLAMEVVLFDKEEKLMSVLDIKAGALSESKTRVKQFDLGKIACESIGSLLLNDITTCDGAGLTPASCLSKVKLAHKTSVPFRQ